MGVEIVPSLGNTQSVLAQVRTDGNGRFDASPARKLCVAAERGKTAKHKAHSRAR